MGTTYLLEENWPPRSTSWELDPLWPTPRLNTPSETEAVGDTNERSGVFAVEDALPDLSDEGVVALSRILNRPGRRIPRLAELLRKK
jgi:hypothetical protein